LARHFGGLTGFAPPVRVVACIVFCCLLAAAVRAEGPPDPEIGYVFPAGGAAGTTVEVRLGIYDVTPDQEYLIFDPRVKLEPAGPAGRLLLPERPYPVGQKAYHPEPLPREIPARIEIPAGMPPGPVRFQIANANGASRVGVFVIGDGGEIVEAGFRDGAQQLSSLPVTVSGRVLRNEEIDRYAIRADRNGPITCTLAARRLGSKLGGVLEVFDAAGRLIGDAVDSRGLDTALTFAAQKGGEYTIAVRDLDFRGHPSFVYRLAITPGPRVVAALPAAALPGETRDVEFIGYGVATGAPVIERVTRPVTFPQSAGPFSYRLETPFGAAPAVILTTGDISESILARPAQNGVPVRLEAPAAVAGLFDGQTREAHFEFESRAGDAWALRAESRSFETPIDLAISLYDAGGKPVAENDDLPGMTDAGLEFTAPADGVYKVVVRHQSLAGGAAVGAYALRLQRARPDFALSVPQRATIMPGATAELVVKAHRSGSFAGPIALSFGPLPAGVAAPPDLVIPEGKAELSVALKAADDAPSGALLTTCTGTAMIEDRRVTHAAVAPSGDNLAPMQPEDRETPQILVAVLVKPRTRIWPVESDERTVNRGSTHLAEVGVERLEGYTGEVLLQLESRQPHKFRQGVLGPDVILPPGQDRILYPCFVPEFLETLDAYRVSVSALCQAPDAAGKPRWLVSKMQATVSIAITVEGGLLKLSSEGAMPRLPAGRESSIALKIVRSPRLAGPVVVECVVPAGGSPLVSAARVSIPPDRSEFEFRVQVSPDAPPGRATLLLRGTATQPGEVPELAETAGATPLEEWFLAHLREGRLPVISEMELPVEIVPE